MKQFSLASGVLKRPVTVIMMTLIVVGFGIFSLTNLRITLFPSLNIPIIAISTGYQNVAPEDIDRLLVTPIEGAISAIEGIEELESNVRRGNAFIRMSLFSGTDIRKTELQIQKAIDQIRNDLPAQAREPVIFQFDPENGGYKLWLNDFEIATITNYGYATDWQGQNYNEAYMPFPENWTLNDDGIIVDWYASSWGANCESFRLIPFWHEAE